MPTDTERIDWLCRQAYYPAEVPATGISLAIGSDVVPPGQITLNETKDAETIRAAIDRAMQS